MTPIRIATWNINGINARVDSLCAWLDQTRADVVCLQEIKCVDGAFPAGAFQDRGYNIVVHGQKGFNGVAILSRRPLETVSRGLPGDGLDSQARYLEAIVPTGRGAMRVASLYLPNGNPVGTDKFTYKLSWMERLQVHARALLSMEEMVVLAGDYNIIPEPVDARNPEAWRNDALFQPQSRAVYRTLLGLGYTDAIRAVDPNSGVYTFWDYQAGAWQKDNGIRIDHLLLSPQAADKLAAAGVDRFTRGWEKPSDHVPVWVEMAV